MRYGIEFLECRLLLSAPPTNLTATAVSPYEVDLMWDANSAADVVTVERAIGSGGQFRPISQAYGPRGTFEDKAAPPDTPLLYRMSESGMPGYSNVATATTALPVNYSSVVRDINTGPSNLPFGPALPVVASNGIGFFSAYDAAHGAELWRTDGTSAGTRLVKDIVAGPSGSDPNALTDLNGTLYFAAYDGTGVYLWRSDGSAAGTAPVNGSPLLERNFTDPATIVRFARTLLIVADDGAGGHELYQFDPATNAFSNLRDFKPPQGYGAIGDLTTVGNVAYFIANDGAHGNQIWKTDATAAGTVMVTNFQTRGFGDGMLQYFVNVNGTLYFTADDGIHGDELWKTDGTTGGTMLVKDIAPGGASSYPSQLTAANGTLYFVVGSWIWKSNGTSAGTVKVTNVLHLDALHAVNGTLFFTTDQYGNGGPSDSYLWKTDGTPIATKLVSDIKSDPNASGIYQMIDFGGELLFFVSQQGRYTLFRSDGSSAGALPLAAGFSRGELPFYDSVFNGALYFVGDEGSVRELWRTDGTPAGTVQVARTYQTTGDSNPDWLTPINRWLYFTATDGTTPGLWKTDGAKQGTTLLRAGAAANLIDLNGTLYFSTSEATAGDILWRSDGTTRGTRPVATFAASEAAPLADFRTAGRLLYFTAPDSTGQPRLWRSDGTSRGTFQLTAAALGGEMTAVGDAMFFTVAATKFDVQLWKSDGTVEGTALLKDFGAGPQPRALPYHLTDVDGTLYFGLETAGSSALWKSDGTAAGTVQVKGGVGFGVEQIHDLTAIGDRLFFAVGSAPGYGDVLWRSDGTASGTVPVMDPTSVRPITSVGNLLAVGGLLYFIGSETFSDAALWRTDGTAAGTVRIRNLDNGGEPVAMFASDSVLFYEDDSHVWRSDGTTPGTIQIAGARSPDTPAQGPIMAQIGGTLFFRGWDPSAGIELLKAPIAPPATVAGRSVFYNDSAFDGNDPAANARDDAAVAADKQALLPGQTATFANYTNYSRGINGIMVDIANLPARAAPSAEDFVFRVENDGDPSSWSAAPHPAQVILRRGSGAGGSDRIDITWPDAAMSNEWLQVIVKADKNTGLSSPDVFYFGNLVGESGKPPVGNHFVVTSADQTAAANDPHGLSNPAPITDEHDYDRDGRVDVIDQTIARLSAGNALLVLHAPPDSALTRPRHRHRETR